MIPIAKAIRMQTRPTAEEIKLRSPTSPLLFQPAVITVERKDANFLVYEQTYKIRRGSSYLRLRYHLRDNYHRSRKNHCLYSRLLPLQSQPPYHIHWHNHSNATNSWIKHWDEISLENTQLFLSFGERWSTSRDPITRLKQKFRRFFGGYTFFWLFSW